MNKLFLLSLDRLVGSHKGHSRSDAGRGDPVWGGTNEDPYNDEAGPGDEPSTAAEIRAAAGPLSM